MPDAVPQLIRDAIADHFAERHSNCLAIAERIPDAQRLAITDPYTVGVAYAVSFGFPITERHAFAKRVAAAYAEADSTANGRGQ